MTKRLDAHVLSLETRAGLAAARSLGRAGYRIGIASWGRRAPGMSTRYADARVVLPNPNGPDDAHVRALVDWLRRHPADAVLTSTDVGLTVLHENRDLVAPYATPAIASADAVETALSKRATVRIADELGVPCPRSLYVASPAEAESAIAELGLPAVIKPVHQWRRSEERNVGFVKPRLVETLADARVVSAEMVSATSPALIQEFVAGQRWEHVQLFRAGGEILAEVGVAAERQWPPFGITTMRRPIDPPEDTRRWAVELASAMDVEGCVSVDFKRDANGRAILMEVNARLVQTLEVAMSAGIDFARMQLEWARGGHVEPVRRLRRSGRIGWLAGDLRLAASACGLVEVKPAPPRWPTLRAIAGDYALGRARIEGLDFRDPLPAIGSIGSAFASLGRTLASRARAARAPGGHRTP